VKILSAEAFLKKLKQACADNADHHPSIEILPNWQLRMQMSEDGEVKRFGGPTPFELKDDAYVVFLSEVDILAGSHLAESYVQDNFPRPGGQ